MIQAYINQEKQVSSVTIEGMTSDIDCELAILAEAILVKFKEQQDKLGNIKTFDEYVEHIASQIKTIHADKED